MCEEFQGKTVLVTGGSRGLGEALCRRFAAAGCRVIVNYAHGKEAAQAVAEAVGGEAVQCDISDEQAAEAVHILNRLLETMPDQV